MRRGMSPRSEERSATAAEVPSTRSRSRPDLARVDCDFGCAGAHPSQALAQKIFRPLHDISIPLPVEACKNQQLTLKDRWPIRPSPLFFCNDGAHNFFHCMHVAIVLAQWSPRRPWPSCLHNGRRPAMQPVAAARVCPPSRAHSHRIRHMMCPVTTPTYPQSPQPSTHPLKCRFPQCKAFTN